MGRRGESGTRGKEVWGVGGWGEKKDGEIGRWGDREKQELVAPKGILDI